MDLAKDKCEYPLNVGDYACLREALCDQYDV